MIEDCTRQISKLCKGANIGIKIPNNFTEHLSSDTSGQAYLDSHFTRDQHPLWRHLLSIKDFNLFTNIGSPTPIFNKQVALDYLASCNPFIRLLAVLIHCTGGQPSRGSEFVDICISNEHWRRNLYKIHGKTWFILQYSKTTNNTNMDQFVPHLLPNQVVQLLDYYIVVI